MSLLGLSKLEKLKILSYDSVDRTSINPRVFEVKFNPESYSRNYKNIYDPTQAVNTGGNEMRYAMSEPEDLKIKLILDGTGVDSYGLTTFLKPDTDDVDKQLRRFLDHTTHMDGDIHSPRHLTLRWGNLDFKCVLLSLNVNYSLFSNSGIPLRAELDVVFREDLPLATIVQEDGKESPDLTHYRVVGAHDELPTMCEKIYGSSQYYLYVARANDLDDFRNLKPGQEIYFPPIEK